MELIENDHGDAEHAISYVINKICENEDSITNITAAFDLPSSEQQHLELDHPSVLLSAPSNLSSVVFTSSDSHPNGAFE